MRQCPQLPIIGFAVLIKVLPNPQLIPNIILIVQNAIAIAVKRTPQPLKVRIPFVPPHRKRNFTCLVNNAIPVATSAVRVQIKHKKAVIRSRPSCLLKIPIFVPIKKHVRAVIDLNTITIKIKNQWLDASIIWICRKAWVWSARSRTSAPISG